MANRVSDSDTVNVNEETARYFGRISKNGFKTEEERNFDGAEIFKKKALGILRNSISTFYSGVSIMLKDSVIERILCESEVVSSNEEAIDLLHSLDGKRLRYSPRRNDVIVFRRLTSEEGKGAYRVTSYINTD